MNNRRSEFEIIGKILDLSKNGAKKTELLYKGNFSYTQLTGYLTFLVNKDILEERTVKDNGQTSRRYITTEKGQNLLRNINKTLSYL
jgi:predicted transcriptional regulator